ncbi:MAG: ABC transporter permease [Chloroflexi bacterium]|nr:ABC transporter permease [Chloroflexota bacterium]MCY3583198.1 ABC transporter permease [Chloroflexota bacterium]MCY3715965.1 ABC transporter permease [Chloroflexota bacterium]MDE2651536.1 ABC transporter permease [Chloroflexota bacterium]MXV93500.1 ABC transporter permease [Chloroflexota bacterium]
MTKAKVRKSRAHEELGAPNTLWRDAGRRLLRHRLAMFGFCVLVVVFLMGIFGPAITPYDPNGMDFANRFAAPSLAHWMGTDDFGRDIFSRIILGARVSLQVGLVAVSVATILGTGLGLLAGYGRRVTDEVIMRAMDVLYSIPALLLAIAIVAALGKGINNAMIAIGLVYIPIFARIARAAVLGIRNEEFIIAARALGAGDLRILTWHVLPNVLSPIIVEITLSLAFAILAEAALSFFGLGTQPPDPSWGRMLAEGRDFFRQSGWMAFFPGLAILFTVMGFNFLGDGLRDALDPRLRR